MTQVRGKMVEITCKCGCGKKRMVREADRKRGWGLFFNKSCKARYQERKTGQCRAYLRGEGVTHAAKRRGENPEIALERYCEKHGIDYDPFDDFDPSWDAHKDSF